MPNIEIADLQFTYRDSKQSIHALTDVQLNIKDGEFLCIIGASGCGKSTLLRLLAGLEMPDSGSVSIGGTPVTGPGADRMIVFQDYALFPWMTARKNVRFAVQQARGVSRAEADEIAVDFLHRVGMDQAKDYYPCQLSGGMRQRVAIARALAMNTDILLLDEPFGALDAKIRASLQNLLLQLWDDGSGKRKTVVFVTHDINEAILLADRVIFMKPGKIETEMVIDLPRPREDEEAFAVYRNRLLQLFGDSEEETEI